MRKLAEDEDIKFFTPGSTRLSMISASILEKDEGNSMGNYVSIRGWFECDETDVSKVKNALE